MHGGLHGSLHSCLHDAAVALGAGLWVALATSMCALNSVPDTAPVCQVSGEGAASRNEACLDFLAVWNSWRLSATGSTSECAAAQHPAHSHPALDWPSTLYRPTLSPLNSNRPLTTPAGGPLLCAHHGGGEGGARGGGRRA